MKIKPFVLAVVFICHIVVDGQTKLYDERYRPQFHFSPAKNWTNDPNGLVYLDGEYHLFYQYNPFGNKWGHMSWGHAVSGDLVHWRHLPLAIPELDSVMIFSGSAVIDVNNTSGFRNKAGPPPMVAIYTAHVIADSSKPDNYRQEQHIAYSLDKGRTWMKYKGNPVLDIHKKDFRDPKVFWHNKTNQWVMAVVLPHEHKVQFYTSPNLKRWTYLSEFGPAGDVQNIWECPDLLEVPIANQPGKKKWVLINSQQTTMQYFVGDFDGKIFRNENTVEKIFRPDHGPDYYAAVTYNLPANQQPVMLGWANNWTYANDIPTFPWKSAMALPRNLYLNKIGNDWVLIQRPVAALKSLRTSPFTANNLVIAGTRRLAAHGQQIELELIFRTEQRSIAGVRLAVAGETAVVIGYDAASEKLFFDRSGVGDTSFNHSYAALSHFDVPLVTADRKIRLHIFFDNSIIEVFANDGAAVMTAQIFPRKGDDGIELFSQQGSTRFDSVKIWKMKSAWR